MCVFWQQSPGVYHNCQTTFMLQRALITLWQPQLDSLTRSDIYTSAQLLILNIKLDDKYSSYVNYVVEEVWLICVLTH